MITSMPKNTPHERLSKLLPSVKCLTCLQPVPLSHLGEHTCEAPPPIPSTAKTMIPPSSSSAVRLSSPAISVRSTSPSNHRQPSSSPPRQDTSSNRLRIDTVTRGPPSPTHSTFKPSPLARSTDAADRLSTSSPKPGPSMRDSHGILSSPLRTRVDTPTIHNNNTNNGGSAQSTPSTARPLLSFNQEYTPREPGPPRARALPQSGFPSGPRQGQPLPPRGPALVGPSPHPQPGMNNNVGPPTNDVPFPRRPSVPGSHTNNGAPQYLPPLGYPRRPGLPGPMISVPAPPPPRVMMIGGDPRQAGTSPRLATASFPPVRPDETVKSGEAFIPPTERGIDTSSGGVAGMAGVGRRGFAAAARAAMFVTPGQRPMGPQPQPNYSRKQMVPQHLDLKAASRPTETPPLSAGSGYSSHSPGPMSPLPQPDALFPQQQPRLQRLHSTPSPPGQQYRDASAPIPIKTSGALAIPPPSVQTNGIENRNSNGNVSSPVSPHMPFFEKYKNSRLPSMSPPNMQTLPNNPKVPLPTADTMNHSMRVPIFQSSGSASVSVGGSSGSKGRGNPTDPSSGGSEYSGLAYADSTDYEDNESERRGRSLTSPRGAPLKESILRSMSNSKSQFGSVSERSRSNDSVSRVRINAARSTLRSEVHSESLPQSNSPAHTQSRSHSRNNSVSSSYSSNASEDGGRARSNSSAIAQALGLSQTPPSKYGKLGGPGVYNVEGRLARSGSGRSLSLSSHSGRSAAGTDEEREKQVTTAVGVGVKVVEVPKMVIRQVSSSAASSSGLGMALRDRARFEAEEDNNVLNLGTKVKAQRSNTVQGVVQAQSPEVKSVKLPTRAQSEREKEKPVGAGESKGGHGHGLPRKVKKSKVCLKCTIAIESGRWVSTDGGGVLCEKCWKNMYLPKCRRCNLPIERQAVSSSDGQLKGKYHKECFNCHECHKSFPDKTFYVYDGKPLCAYHYHEANDSLCAAGRCGQPIEGPCAVSHTGDRYHPEHMTCEHPGSDCDERLRDYWEVEGRMLCEHHAVHASRVGNDDEERWVGGKKGMKRVTMFIDLAGGNLLANNRGDKGQGDVGDSGLR